MNSDGIKTIRFNGREPSIAYTDFTAIYISNSLVDDELAVASKHEKAHIWLQHQIRGAQIDNIDHFIANIAMDLEIAKYIYNDFDESIIGNIHSLLHKGITKKDVKKFPNCEYFEDFYEELMKQKEQIKKSLKSIDSKGNKVIKSKDTKDTSKDISREERKKTIDNAKNQGDKESEQYHKKKCNTMAQHLVTQFKSPKPTIASTIDSIFGRNKLRRVDSYRRPNRVESEFISKGSISSCKIPTMSVYVDRSGSFDSSKTQEATQLLKTIIRKYRGKIANDSFYFNDSLMVRDPLRGNGGTNYQCIIDHIVRNPSELSIIITDEDTNSGLELPVYKNRILIIPVGCNQTWLACELRKNGYYILEACQ